MSQTSTQPLNELNEPRTPRNTTPPLPNIQTPLPAPKRLFRSGNKNAPTQPLGFNREGRAVRVHKGEQQKFFANNTGKNTHNGVKGNWVTQFVVQNKNTATLGSIPSNALVLEPTPKRVKLQGGTRKRTFKKWTFKKVPKTPAARVEVRNTPTFRRRKSPKSARKAIPKGSTRRAGL